jgi:Holliday junction resolvase RusA-like endonuclease
MQTINIELADNGVIKTVVDDNINGGGEAYESTTVYEFNSIANKIKFVEELSVDIGLEFGNSKSKTQIQVGCDWGDSYKPTDTEIDIKIKNFNDRIEKLQKLKDG